MEIRFATETDAEGIVEIYTPVVVQTPTSFETTPPSVSEMAARIRHTLDHYPWLVYVEGPRILGYAYATAFRQREAYQWSVEVSAYVHENARRRGLGRRLYTALFEILRTQGFANAFAGIALPNDASVALHEAMGFRAIGTYTDVGYKLGSWHDVGWWQRPLASLGSPPLPPRPLPDVRHSTATPPPLLPLEHVDQVHREVRSNPGPGRDPGPS